MESNRLPIEIIDDSEQPIASLPVCPREVVIMQAAVLNHEDGLAEQYGDSAVELAEQELRAAFAGATGWSWRSTTRESLDTDPQQAAKRYVLGLGSGTVKALRPSRPAMEETRVEATAADSAVAVNMQELLEDDDTGPIGLPLQAAAVDGRSLQVHAAMTERSRRTLLQAMEEERTALHVSSATITMAALTSRIAELRARDNRALRDEVDEVRRSISGVLPVVAPELQESQESQEQARRLLVPGLAAVAALSSIVRFGR